jgi:hypothetical protein
MGWSLVPGDNSGAALPPAGGVGSQDWPVSGGDSFSGSAASAFSQPQYGRGRTSNVAIVPDANGLLPGQTKFYTPPPTLDAQGQVISSVGADGAPLIQPTLSISRAALPALQAAPANAFASAGSNFGGGGLNANRGGSAGGNAGGGAASGGGLAGGANGRGGAAAF